MKSLQAMNNSRDRFTLEEVSDTQTRIIHEDNEIIVNMSIDHVSLSWKLWTNLGYFIQDAFPMLSKHEREFLMTGLTKEMWDELFSDYTDEYEVIETRKKD